MLKRSIILLLAFMFQFAHALPSGQIPPTIDVRQALAQPKIEKINLNHATVKELTGAIKGIGPKKAQSIVTYRQEHHGFKQVEEIGNVKGIGKKFVERNRRALHQRFTV